MFTYISNQKNAKEIHFKHIRGRNLKGVPIPNEEVEHRDALNASELHGCHHLEKSKEIPYKTEEVHTYDLATPLSGKSPRETHMYVNQGPFKKAHSMISINASSKDSPKRKTNK